MNIFLKQIYCCFLVGAAMTIVGCGGAEDIVTPRKVDVVINQGIPVLSDQTKNVRMYGAVNTTPLVLQLIPNESKIILYSYPDSTFAINIDCAVANVSGAGAESFRLDSLSLRTGFFSVTGKTTAIRGIMQSNDSLAAKFRFTVKDSRQTVPDTVFEDTQVFRNSIFDMVLLDNLIINRIIDGSIVVDDTIRKPFNPFEVPYDRLLRKDTSIRIIINTTVKTQSSKLVVVEPAMIGKTFFAPTLTATIDKKRKLITAELTFSTNNEPLLTDNFDGKNVQTIVVLEIPVPKID